MNVALAALRPTRRRRYRWRRVIIGTASVTLGTALVIWSLLPVYNMMLIALDPEGENEFDGKLWPPEPSLDSFRVVWTQGHWYLENIWHQFGNSLYIGLLTMLLTLLISSLASFAIGRLRLSKAWLLTDTALLIYVVPASLLAIPFSRLAQAYGLSDNLWAVIAAQVMLATPFAVLILHQYGKLVPIEFDEAAWVDGASPVQVYLRIYLPLMAPALAAVGIYALLLAWDEYLYQYLLLSSPRNWTVAVAIEQFFDSDEAPWNAMMALALIYALPPVVSFYVMSRYMATRLTSGGVKG
jgi:multiple sugar transport system permease protein